MTDQIDLGQKPTKPSPTVVASPAQEPKISYPSFTVRDAVAKQVVESLGIESTGEEFQLSVRVSVSGMRDDEYGRSVDFKVLNLSECECNDAGNASEMEEEEECEEPAEESPMVRAAKTLKKGA